MANSADPDQLASSEANWSGSTLFAKAGYIRAQQDKGFKRFTLHNTHVRNASWDKSPSAIFEQYRHMPFTL